MEKDILLSLCYEPIQCVDDRTAEVRQVFSPEIPLL